MLKIEKTVRTVSLLNNPALVSTVRQPAIDLPTRHHTHEEYQAEIKRYS